MDTNKQISFFIPMRIPTKTFQAKKLRTVKGRAVLYTPPELVEIRQKYISALIPHSPAEPAEGPISLCLMFCFKDKKHNTGTPKTTKPDLDNLEKGLADCMTVCGFWQDDSQISLLSLSKSYEEHEGVFIKVEELKSK
jgi:Holliday junction resolvase RusA-like endonuclease